MVNVFAASVLMSAAAWIGERAARGRGISTRWVWMSALSGPFVVSFIALLDRAAWLHQDLEQVLTQVNPVSNYFSFKPWIAYFRIQHAPDFDLELQLLWCVTSLATATKVGWAVLRLRKQRNTWHEEEVAGVRLYSSKTTGPAVVGWLRPRIVVPDWVLHVSRQEQDHILAHENSHIRAHDPQLVAVALIGLCVMPWNLTLWWQFARLRRAIEIDCDERVLSGGRNRIDYCETLISASLRRAAQADGVIAMGSSTSLLEQRIANICCRRKSHWLNSLAFASCASCATLLAVTMTVSSNVHVAVGEERTRPSQGDNKFNPPDQVQGAVEPSTNDQLSNNTDPPPPPPPLPPPPPPPPPPLPAKS
jgi:hypothetical protein